MRRLSLGLGLSPLPVPDQQTRRESPSINQDELEGAHVSDLFPASEPSGEDAPPVMPPVPEPVNPTPQPRPNSPTDAGGQQRQSDTSNTNPTYVAGVRRRFSLGPLVIRVHTLQHKMESVPAAGSKFQLAVWRIIYLNRLINMIKSRDRRQVERACEKLLDIINAPQNSEILHDLYIEPVLLSLLSLDPLGHWKIVGYALHGLFTLALNPKCSRVIVKCEGIDATLEQYLRSERFLVQRLTAGIVCRVFRQPLTHEWKLFTQGSARMVSLLLSLLASASGGTRAGWEMQLEALSVCNDLTYHLDNTIILCKRPEFMARLSELVLVQDSRVRHTALLVLRNVVCSAQVSNIILRAVRDVAKELEKGLLTQLEAAAYQETMRVTFNPMDTKEQLFVARARESECYQLLLECLWFIRTCFSRLRKDSVQPEDAVAEFQSKLKQSASRFMP